MATYSLADPHSGNTDWVRLLTGDTGTTAATADMSDEEIDFFIAGVTVTDTDAIRYVAAADVLGAILAKWLAKGRGTAEKRVSKLHLIYSGRGDVNTQVRERINELRRLGALRATPKSRFFRVVP